MAKTLFGQWTLIWICRLEKGVVYLDLLQEKFIEFYLSIPITLVLLWCWDWPVLNKIKSLTLSLLLQLSPRLLDPCFDFFLGNAVSLIVLLTIALDFFVMFGLVLSIATSTVAWDVFVMSRLMLLIATWICCRNCMLFFLIF